MRSLPLSPQVFAIWSALLEDVAGMHYGVSDQELLAGKLAARAEEVGFESLLDYYYFVRYDPAGPEELQRLIDTLVVNETYFFRELEPLQVAVDAFLLPAIASRGEARVWCAAASTGEEPLTLAMLLANRGLLSKVRIVASDISERALARAREGRFGRRSVRQVPDPELSAAWLRGGPDQYEIAPELVRAIDWRRVNLLDTATVRRLGRFDVILCRNVLIYFRDEVASRTAELLAECLEPGGALIVGVSESLLRFGTSLSCEEHEGVFFYRRRA